MKHIFFFFTIIAIIYELNVFVAPKRFHKFIRSMKSKQEAERTSTEKTLGVLVLFYVLWAFCGLFTDQWPLFMLIIIMGMIPKPYAFIRMIDAIVSAAVLTFMILNVYHLHIDLQGLLIEYLRNI